MEDFVTEDDDSIATTLGQDLLSLSLYPSTNRYFGKSSGPMLVQKAIHLKKEYDGDDAVSSYKIRPEFLSCNPVCVPLVFCVTFHLSPVLRSGK